MAVTLGELKTRILFETDKSGSDFEYGVTNAIVTAIKYLEHKHPWVFNKTGVITISAGTNYANLPDDFSRLLDAKYSIGNCLYGARQGFTNVTYADLNSYMTTTAETGYPARYAIYGAQLYVTPNTANAIDVTISYNYKDSSYPSNDDDISVWFDDQTIDLVRNKALEIFYRDTLQTPELADTYLGIFQDYSNNLSKRNNTRLVQNVLSI